MRRDNNGIVVRTRVLFFSILISLLILTSCGLKNPASDDVLEKTLESKITLRFDENGEFRVLVLSDLHLEKDLFPQEMDTYLKELVDREKPDLVILNGDNIRDPQIDSDDAMKSTISKAIAYIEDNGIPWAHVFGNHDSEAAYSREAQQKVYESFRSCLSKAGNEELSGVGNYVIPVYAAEGDAVKFVIWCLDSGAYMSEADKKLLAPVTTAFPGYEHVKYDYIHGDQIEWYVQTSQMLQAKNDGEVVPGLMAFHIPLQEFYAGWLNAEELEHAGQKREAVGASSYNSGLFSVMLHRGDIKAVVCGHDHANDYMVEYGGIKLCYASTITTIGYHDPESLGGRVFIIKESDPTKVETYISYVNR